MAIGKCILPQQIVVVRCIFGLMEVWRLKAVNPWRPVMRLKPVNPWRPVTRLKAVNPWKPVTRLKPVRPCQIRSMFSGISRWAMRIRYARSPSSDLRQL